MRINFGLHMRKQWKHCGKLDLVALRIYLYKMNMIKSVLYEQVPQQCETKENSLTES